MDPARFWFSLLCLCFRVCLFAGGRLLPRLLTLSLPSLVSRLSSPLLFENFPSYLSTSLQFSTCLTLSLPPSGLPPRPCFFRMPGRSAGFPALRSCPVFPCLSLFTSVCFSGGKWTDPGPFRLCLRPELCRTCGALDHVYLLLKPSSPQ